MNGQWLTWIADRLNEFTFNYERVAYYKCVYV
jgi:hypothetical protein